MFLSKIWFFLVAVAGAIALTLALVMPKPAQREQEVDEKRRLVDACSVTNILLTENARNRIDLAGEFALVDSVADVLREASKEGKISAERNHTARQAGRKLLNSISGSIAPDFVIMLDAKGRVVGRVGMEETEYGDSMAGYHVVDDALAGYLRDDLWQYDRSLYRVAAAPVIDRSVDPRGRYVGAVVLGHHIDKDFATSLAKRLKFEVAFYVGERSVANSTAIQLHKDVITKFKELGNPDRPRAEDCGENEPFAVNAGNETFAVLVARLPGEAANFGAFYAVYVERPKAVGFMGTIHAAKKEDLSFDNFPWIRLGVGFLLVVAVGFFFMIIEADRPLRKLSNDAVALAKGERDRLEEERHRGKFGSIARSVNIELDKKQREAKAAKKDLDQLLGPAPDDGVSLGAGNLDPLGTTPLPATGPGRGADADFKPPPPSDFKFGGKAPPAVPKSVADPGAPFELDLPPPPPSVAATEPRESTPPPATPESPIPPPPIDLPGGDGLVPPPPPPAEASSTPPPVPVRKKTPPPMPAAAPPEDAPPPEEPKRRTPSTFDDPTLVADPSQELLDASAERDDEEDTRVRGEGEDDDETFRRVFEEFIALKKKCGESINNLTYKKFAAKLKKNREALIAKHGCDEVRFQVYIKDGRAALKATPVKS